MTSSDPLAVLPAAYTFTSSDQGRHTFTVVLVDPGTQSISATDTTNKLSGTESGIGVTAALPQPAVSLAVTSSTQSVTAGTQFTVTVKAMSAAGTVVTGYAGTVRLSTNNSSASGFGTYTFVPSTDDGSHTFNVTLDTAGLGQWIQASDTVALGVAGLSPTIIVTPAVASHLVVNLYPGTTTSGAEQTFRVTAEDSHNNVATGYTGTVHFTSSDSQAVLPANYTFTSTDNGSHTFSAALVTTTSAQTITATDTSTSITGYQSSILVDAQQSGAPAALELTGVQETETAGTQFSVTVTALLANGTTDTAYTGTVQFSSSDLHASLPGNYTFTAANDGTHTST